VSGSSASAGIEAGSSVVAAGFLDDCRAGRRADRFAGAFAGRRRFTGLRVLAMHLDGRHEFA